MTKAPERIWAHTEYDDDGEMFIEYLSDEPWPGLDVGVEYTRTDLSNALIAAAYEAAALRHEELWRENSAYKAHQIRALTPADARAALERVAQPRWYRMDDPENPPPKDGRLVMLIRGRDCDNLRIARWYEPWSVWHESSDIPPDENSDFFGIGELWPTHWSPLLAPPEDEG